ncbi:MAG: PIN domain-containing protein [Acidobacteria bacterium]|nr:PIN domain-containing protein [Acidobacteriota bacterium]
MLLLDTSGLLAAVDASQARHADCAAVITGKPGPFLLSSFVLAELDYLLGTRVGAPAQQAMLAEVVRGAYRLESFEAADVEVAQRVIAKYRDLQIGLADASLVVLAARHRVRDILTLDRRHFDVIRPLTGRAFRLWP